MEKVRSYIAIDLKSFYASVECMERSLDPMTTNLVVADASKTEKTICLAVSPSLKSFGIPGRPRLFEVIQKVKAANHERRQRAPGYKLTEESYNYTELKSNPSLAVSYIIAPPQMAKYMEISTKIFGVYLKYVAEEDIYAYSIDEVFIDATDYLGTYKCSAHDLAIRMIRDVLATTGITATAGIGPNLYLAKIAMDIKAKKMPADKDGVRIAELDEMSYRRELWNHTPLTSFWRVGKGIAKKLEEHGMYTMGDVARCSIYNEELLYKLFGVNAELLIDHAWGWEPVTMDLIKQYKPETNSVSSGQVLTRPYEFKEAKLVVREMTELMVLDLVDKGLVTNQLVLTINYDVENLTDHKKKAKYTGQITTDIYGRQMPKHAHGTQNLKGYSSSTKMITNAVMELFDRIVDKDLTVRKINLIACRIIPESDVPVNDGCEQMDLFTDYDALAKQRDTEKEDLEREKRMQKAMLGIKKRFGKNAILKGMNLQEGATARQRNEQIGGHAAGPQEPEYAKKRKKGNNNE